MCHFRRLRGGPFPGKVCLGAAVSSGGPDGDVSSPSISIITTTLTGGGRGIQRDLQNDDSLPPFLLRPRPPVPPVPVGWLDDIGLPQYKDQFHESRVDGRMLQYLTVVRLLPPARRVPVAVKLDSTPSLVPLRS